jgi:hypothetical protein
MAGCSAATAARIWSSIRVGYESVLRLADLLVEESFGLELLSGDPEAEIQYFAHDLYVVATAAAAHIALVAETGVAARP